MKPVSQSNLEKKRDGINVNEVSNQKDENVKGSNSTKSHREVVLNNCKRLIKWAYDNK